LHALKYSDISFEHQHRYYLILKNKDDLKNDDYEYDHILNAHVTESYIAERILEISSYLNEAYRIKEEFISLNDETPETFKDRSEKEKELNSLIRRMMVSEIPEMIECAKTLKNWKEEILNSFVWFEGRRQSNGPIEGKNNYIKKIISNANGLQNFERARNKFMYSQNLYEEYTVSEHKNKIKKAGKQRGKYKKKDDK
jgi:Transposase and inactivated derivatives